MKKKIFAIIAVALSLLMLASCNGEDRAKKERRENLKIGLIVSGDESDPYTILHINGIDDLVKSADLNSNQIIKKTGITEENCYSTAVELVEEGCNLIFAVGSGLEDYIVQAATEKFNVQFCVAKGTQAATTGLANLHSYSVAESESRYVSGVAAGLKLNDMIENGEISADNIKVGYVGSMASAENTSAYTAFYLGAKSVCPGVSLDVQYAGLENSENLERIAANALIANGCVLIAQHSYTNGAAETCEQNNVYFVGNVASANDKAPNFAVTSSSSNWNACYTYAVNCIVDGIELPVEWANGYDSDACGILELNENTFASKDRYNEAKAKISETEKALKEKTLNVFDTATWTVGSEAITTTANEELASYYYGTEYIADGYFKEYEFSSLPKFQFRIDGIAELN